MEVPRFTAKDKLTKRFGNSIIIWELTAIRRAAVCVRQSPALGRLYQNSFSWTYYSLLVSNSLAPLEHVCLNKEYIGLTSIFILYAPSRTNTFFSLFSALFRPLSNHLCHFKGFFYTFPATCFRDHRTRLTSSISQCHKIFILILCSKLQLLIFRRPYEDTCYLYPYFHTIHDAVLKSRPTQVETCKDMVLTLTRLMLTRQGGR